MKRNGIMVSGVVVIILVVAALFGWQTMTANAAATNKNLATATVQRGTLVATVSAAGNVSAPQSAALSFQSTGRVAQVNVQVGDSVKQGQTLMALDTTDLDLALKSAQANVANAQANFDSAKAKDATNADQITAAKATLDKTTAALQQAQAAYDKIGGASNPGIGMTSQSLALQSATDDYKTALSNYNITMSSINDTALRAAQAQLDTAQIAVQQAQDNLAKAQVVAPFDGVVSAVNYNAGDTAGTNAAINLVSLGNLQVQVTIAEVDLPKIQVGQAAQLTLDALPGKTYNAKVIKIDPVGTITQGVVNYPVTVAITDADGSIDPGMTANLNVVVDQRNDVLMVPARAVHTQGNQKFVTVLYKGQSIQEPVTTGLTNDQSIEITNGLQVGDTVVLNQTQTQTGGGGRGPGGGAFLIGR
jgi:multidrug efflux pump subunit AcrA (membrane-fusion protein)